MIISYNKMAVNESNQMSDKSCFNWFTKFFRFFKFKSNSRETKDTNMSILELTSRLVTRSELDLILEQLPEDSYQTNCNKTIYSLKSNGKPFFIDLCEYNYDIYTHQINVGNGIYFCDKHRDLMYVLRILFYEQNISEVTPQELQFILEVLPKSYYSVNSNQTIYSFKLNGKPFFIDKSHYNYNDYPLQYNTSPHMYSKGKATNDIVEETDLKVVSPKTLAETYAERNRLDFIKLKTRLKDSKLKSIENITNNGLNGDICVNYWDNKQKNSENTDPSTPKSSEMSKALKLSKNLSKRKVQKSDLMIRNNNIKEAKHILKNCRQSIYDWKERNERRKLLEIKAKLSPVNNCDVLNPGLYAICEAIEPNDINHNSNY